MRIAEKNLVEKAPISELGLAEGPSHGGQVEIAIYNNGEVGTKREAFRPRVFGDPVVIPKATVSPARGKVPKLRQNLLSKLGLAHIFALALKLLVSKDRVAR